MHCIHCYAKSRCTFGDGRWPDWTDIHSTSLEFICYRTYDLIGSENVIRGPSVKTQSTQGLSMQAAKRRDKAQGVDRMHEQRKYELSHED